MDSIWLSDLPSTWYSWQTYSRTLSHDFVMAASATSAFQDARAWNSCKLSPRNAKRQATRLPKEAKVVGRTARTKHVFLCAARFAARRVVQWRKKCTVHTPQARHRGRWRRQMRTTRSAWLTRLTIRKGCVALCTSSQPRSRDAMLGY